MKLVMALIVLGCVITFICGCTLPHQQTTRWANVAPQATHQKSVNPFVGKWINKNENTPGISKFSVCIVNHQIIVEMWGKCHPQDCYWGTMVAEVPENTTDQLRVVWVATFKNEFQLFTLNDGMITLQGKTFYTDNSSRKDREYTEYFIRGKFD